MIGLFVYCYTTYNKVYRAIGFVSMHIYCIHEKTNRPTHRFSRFLKTQPSLFTSSPPSYVGLQNEQARQWEAETAQWQSVAADWQERAAHRDQSSAQMRKWHEEAERWALNAADIQRK